MERRPQISSGSAVRNFTSGAFRLQNTAPRKTRMVPELRMLDITIPPYAGCRILFLHTGFAMEMGKSGCLVQEKQ